VVAFGEGGVGVLTGVGGGYSRSGGSGYVCSNILSEWLYALSVENESEDTDVGEEMLDASSLEIRDELVPCVIVKVLGRGAKRP
jgi:hypothetical protein